MNFNKEAMRYAKANNYYSLGKIKRFLKLEFKERERLVSLVPTSVCPDCRRECTAIEHSDEEYSCDSWVYCDNCGNCYDDDKYIDAIQDVDVFLWFDEISSASSFKHYDTKSYSWKKFCDSTIDKMITELQKSNS